MEVRGTALRSTIAACNKLFGEGSAQLVLDNLESEPREALGGVILGAAWYPVRFQAALHEGIRLTLGHGSIESNKSVGRQAALDDFQGVYRVFLPLLTRELLWTSVGRAWLRYNSRGEIIFSEKTRRSAVAQVLDVDGYNEPMWGAISGRLCGVLELAGGHRVQARIRSWSASRCLIAVTWEP